MKSYVNNSNSKINTSKENIKRRKSNEWNMREITTMNRERIQKKKKDKITWQVIIHSTFFFLWLFFSLSFSRWLFSIDSNWNFILIFFLFSFWLHLFKMYLKRKERKERNSRSRKKWWNFLICRNDETQWNDWRKTNQRERKKWNCSKQRKQITKRKI